MEKKKNEVDNTDDDIKKDRGNEISGNNGTNDVGSEKLGVIAEAGGSSHAGTVLSTNEKKVPVAHTWKVPDGGWGWVIVVSALVISFIVDGLSYTFGIFLTDFERAFHEPKSTISLASSIQVGLYLFIGPIVSALTNRFGCRNVIIAGTLVSSLAFIASSWSTSVTILILTYGVVGGIGFGLMYLPSIVAVSIYFEEKRAVATGIAVCGSGIGTFLLAPLTDYLLHQYNWSWTLFILGALILNGVVFGLLIRPLELQPVAVETNNDNAGLNVQGEYDKTVDKGKRTQAYNSSNKLSPQEQVPLIDAVHEGHKNVAVSQIKETNKEDISRSLYSSTPNMINNNTPQLTSAVLKDGNHNTSNKFPLSRSVGRPRSNTLDVLLFKGHNQSMSTSDNIVSSTPSRAHTPLGLSIISLTDANLSKIREDLQVSLSRKDIHLSGPLAFPEADIAALREENSPALYVQSRMSVVSLTGKDGLETIKVKRHGIWACLPASAQETLEEMLSFNILKDKGYWCVLMGNFFCMIGFYVPFVYVPDHAKLMGIDEGKAAFLLSIIGITNTVGRVLTGVLINFLNIDCAMVTAIALALAGIMTAVFPLCYTFAALASVSAIFGVCLAAYISLCSVLLCELLGVENLTNAFGFVILFRGVACIMGPPMAGAIFDATGIYDPSFYIGGSMIFLGAISHAFLLIPCCKRPGTAPSNKV